MKKAIITCVLALITIYVSFAQQWEKKTDFKGTPPRSGVAFSIGNFGYWGLGDNSQKEFWKYDPVADKWSAIAPFPGPPRVGAVVAVVNGKAYVGCGGTEGFFGDPESTLDDFYEYDPVSNKWTQKASCPEALLGSTCFGYDNTNGGIIYLLMGQTITTSFAKAAYSYSPKTNTWTTISKIKYPAGGGSYPLHSTTSFMWNKKGYFSGGKNSSVVYSSIYSFNPDSIATNPWKELNINDNYDMAYKGSGSFGLGNKAYVCYGKYGKGIIEFDNTTKKLTTIKDPFGVADEIQGMSSFVINDSKAYVFGGTIGWSSFGTPNTAVWSLGTLKVPTNEVFINNVEVKYHYNTQLLELDSDENILDVEIYTTDGALVSKINNINSSSFEKNCDEFLSGLYFIKINTSKGFTTKKILVH